MTLYKNFKSKITKKQNKSKARLGILSTPHGDIQTPNFIFCGTKASIKNLHPHQMREAGTDIILSNTYHLMIQPGGELIERMGGLHKFMGWDGPMLTDSGGFQVFSLGHGADSNELIARNKVGGKTNVTRKKSLLKITEEGTYFKSYKTGEKLFLSPEIAMDIQRQLGADLIMQFDECTALHMDKEYTRKSMHRSHRWGQRCIEHFTKHDNGKQALYGILQGGVFLDLRKEAAEWSAQMPFFGNAIGGSVGETKEQFYEISALCSEYMDTSRPLHMLGIGAIDDVFANVRLGTDTFDCVSPTRLARHGGAIIKGVKGNKINLMNAKFKYDETPLNANLENPSSSKYSKSYIHHLLKSKELLGTQILSQHNVAMMNLLMREVRKAIQEDNLDELEKEWIVN